MVSCNVEKPAQPDLVRVISFLRVTARGGPPSLFSLRVPVHFEQTREEGWEHGLGCAGEGVVTEPKGMKGIRNRGILKLKGIYPPMQIRSPQKASSSPG